MQKIAAKKMAGLCVLLCSSALAQSTGTTPGMNMPESDSGSTEMRDMPGMGDGSEAATQAMQSHHLDMGPHMKMTVVRPLQPGDQQKADDIIKAARAASEKYKG